MRAELQNILHSYEDFELAFLWKYKLRTYLDDTQSDILNYIKTERGLSITTLEALITEYADKRFEDAGDRWPRYKSKKILANDEEYWNTGHQAGYYYEAAALDGLAGRSRQVKKLVCAVCDHVIQDLNNNIGYWDRVKDIVWRKLLRRGNV